MINELLRLPFAHRVATRDWHPSNHVSFGDAAATEPGKQPFTGSTVINDPKDPPREETIRLWPPHCIQDTPGAQLIPELDASRLDLIVDKGRNPQIEMLSALADVFGHRGGAADSSSVDVLGWLQERGVTDVFVTGIAGDYCVRHSALDVARGGLRTWIVRDAVVSIDDGPDGWGASQQDFHKLGAQVIDSTSDEVSRVRAWEGQ